ncbi:unnamed protein product [Sphagnum balticum]
MWNHSCCFLHLALNTFYEMPVLIWCSVMPNTEMVRVTALVGSSSFLDQDGLEHRSPLSSDTLMNNGSSGDILMAGLMYNFLSPSFPVSFALSSDFFALSPPSDSWRSWSLAFSSCDPVSHMVGFVIDVHAWSTWRPVPEQEGLPVLYLEEKRQTAHFVPCPDNDTDKQLLDLAV